MATPAPDPGLIARLARHRSLGSAPRAEHEWLAAHGTLRTVAAGEVIVRRGAFATSLHVLFSGAHAIHVDRGAGSHKIMEWRGGDVGGVLPYSRGATPPNDLVAEEPTEFLDIPAQLLPEMIRECPVVTTKLVHAMLDRARTFNTRDLHDEKLVSLGRLAAGLAHELNNPASAALRSAKLLAAGLDADDAAVTAIGAARLSDEQLAAVNAVRDLCATPNLAPGRSAMDRADREEAISNWLVAHGASESCAAPLAETGLTLAALDRLAASVRGEALDATLRWISARCLVRALASEIQTATSRIYDLVDSVRGFTYMDRAPTPEPVDIRRGISDTFTMLAAKMRAKSVEASLEFADDLPRAHAVGAELNQVWMNLIDNALDAVPVGGHVSVQASRARDRVVVQITDDGAGISAGILDRIFDPFFTTKGVGQGTGLGLATVRRILQQHDGEIEVESRPGHTRFRVSLPAEKN
ncbi:MAG TPA: ATP-binding protein [Gemmatimonadales bacterium]